MIQENFNQRCQYLQPHREQFMQRFFPVYGKPTKPRCQQPNMFQILSWNLSDGQTQKSQNKCCKQINQIKCGSSQKLMHCKSLPPQQFSKQTNKTINFYSHDSQPDNSRQSKLNQECEYQESQKIKKQAGSLNKIPTPNKRDDSKKIIRTGDACKNTQVGGFYENIIQNTKQRKLQKKSVPFYSGLDRKPRYMQEKKTAMHKLIQRPDFDKSEFQRRKQQQIKKFKQTTRDLSNTSFLTYFNKPPFENYGRQNKHSMGVLYGDYMYSHNVFPHTGDNKPKKQQTYVSALQRAKSAANIHPHPPMTRNLENNFISGYLTLSQIYPKNTSSDPIPIYNQTVLQNLPRFNLQGGGCHDHPKYSPYSNANENQQSFIPQNQYLNKEQIPRFFSNKNQIGGKQINYTKNIMPFRKIA